MLAFNTNELIKERRINEVIENTTNITFVDLFPLF